MTDPFYQGGNKESRIITASAMVNQSIIMPFGWETRYKAIYDHVTTFLRNFDANTHDDPEDGLTGIYEKRLPTAIYNHTHTPTGALNVVTNNLIEICKFITEKVYNFAT